VTSGVVAKTNGVAGSTSWPIDPPPPIDGQLVEIEIRQLDNVEGLRQIRGEDE